MNLINYWIQTETSIPGRRVANALRDMEAELGRRITHSRLRQWQDGRLGLPDDVRHYMIEVAADRIIEDLELCITPEELHRLVRIIG
jgi:hypothetical protein